MGNPKSLQGNLLIIKGLKEGWKRLEKGGIGRNYLIRKRFPQGNQ